VALYFGFALIKANMLLYIRLYPEITVDNFCCYFIYRCANFYWHGCRLNDTVDIYTLRLWRTLSAGKPLPSLRSSKGLAWLAIPAGVAAV
jgi:hypothetical protein